jgi:hypothetical protein
MGGLHLSIGIAVLNFIAHIEHTPVAPANERVENCATAAGRPGMSRLRLPANSFAGPPHCAVAQSPLVRGFDTGFSLLASGL